MKCLLLISVLKTLFSGTWEPALSKCSPGFSTGIHIAWQIDPPFYTNTIHLVQGTEVARKGSSCMFLPIELTSFKAVPSGTGNLSIRWTATGEKNVFYYFLEGSTDGNRYHQLAAVAALHGKGSNAYSYTYTFREPIAYMRLMMVDEDGKRAYSRVITVGKRGLVKGSHGHRNHVHSTAPLLCRILPARSSGIPVASTLPTGVNTD